uniref:Uncharacterized protein LOC108049441 n=1 Tax=Drosophila rhopaloa TaxID=1041015 RepID=A0A6P4F747_DRORH
MCCRRNRKYCCFLVAVIAIIVALSELAYKYYQLAILKVVNFWIVTIAVAWILIIIGVFILIVGAITENQHLLLMWILGSMVCGVSLVVMKMVLFFCFFRNSEMGYHLLSGFFIIFFILLFFLFAYYPYGYLRQLEDQIELN